MRDFDVLRYLRKWRPVILLLAILGSLLVYLYGSKQQAYTATAIIEYTSASAAEGNNPDGSPIDTTEIISAGVITDVIDDLQLDANIESIRSRFTITEIIPEEEADKQEAALELGMAYSYFPTVHQISFTVPARYDADYARDVLDSLLSNYFSFYCEQYVNVAVFPNNASNVSVGRYEYIDCVTILENTISEIVYYLENRAALYPNYCSAATGYSFADLAASYAFIEEHELMQLHAYILENKLVLDQAVLVGRYENARTQNALSVQTVQEHAEQAKEIIDQFGEKTLESEKTYSLTQTSEDPSTVILGTVEDRNGNASQRAETTYDKLIESYAQLGIDRIGYEVGARKQEELIGIFGAEDVICDPNSEQAIWASERIDQIAAQLNALYALALPTIEEFNQMNGAQNLAMRSSIAVQEKINVNLYIMLAAVFFLMAGCFMAVFCGRLGDWIEYYFYVDKKTGLLSRNRCDAFFEHYEKRMLPDAFSVFALKMSLGRADMHREDGDAMLRHFGQILHDEFHGALLAGYNGEGVFLVMMKNCQEQEALEHLREVEEAVSACNAQANWTIAYKAGVATSTAAGVYRLRALLRLAMEKWDAPEAQQADSQSEGQSV